MLILVVAPGICYNMSGVVGVGWVFVPAFALLQISLLLDRDVCDKAQAGTKTHTTLDMV